MPDWNIIQHPDERSPEHGKHDGDHGPGEHGLGAIRSPEAEKGKRPFLRLPGLYAPDGSLLAGVTDTTAPELAGLTFPSSLYVPSTPPVTTQIGGTCTAYSSAYDQNQQDRPEQGAFVNFDEQLFYKQIGGTTSGAAIVWALDRRVGYGYPVTTIGAALKHRIKSYAKVPLTVEAIKAALSAYGADGRRHGVQIATTWYHSWFHPLASGKLPAPDYSVGGHAIWLRGWNDSYGFRLRNTWGSSWGPISGDCFLPYAFLPRLWEAWSTVDL